MIEALRAHRVTENASVVDTSIITRFLSVPFLPLYSTFSLYFTRLANGRQSQIESIHKSRRH